MVRLLKPRALKSGATLGIAAPAGPVDSARLEAGEAMLREAGFSTVRRDDLLAREGYLAGSDERRAQELMELVRDSSVDGIICARGGYGCDRIIPRLDAAAFREAAKPLVGYSDITALLLWQRRCAGLVGFHGPMLDRGSDVEPAAWGALLAALTGELELPYVLRGAGRGGGSARGRLVGGSLSMLVCSVGTCWEVETRGAILLLEDVGDRPYRIDRMLQHLSGAGKLASIAGIGVGAFAECEDARYPEPAVGAVLEAGLRPLGVPLVTGLSFGHLRANYPWAMGVSATIDGDSGELRIEEQGVKRAS